MSLTDEISVFVQIGFGDRAQGGLDLALELGGVELVLLDAAGGESHGKEP